MRKSIIFALFCMLPLLFGCSNSDDVSDIFVAKTWRLNYISEGGKGTTWYSFSDVTSDNYQAYSSREKTFTISFNGVQSDDTIQGTFTGSGSLTAGGNWTANGDSGNFTTSGVYGTVEDQTDIIAQKILYGLEHAKSYTGDTNGNLFIHFDYEGKTLLMAFSTYSK